MTQDRIKDLLDATTRKLDAALASGVVVDLEVALLAAEDALKKGREFRVEGFAHRVSFAVTKRCDDLECAIKDGKRALKAARKAADKGPAR